MEGLGSSDGGCCIARYTHYNPNTTTNTTTSNYPYTYTYCPTSEDLSRMDRIMLRFRPIAPKPATVPTKPTTSTGSNDDYVKCNMGKRKRKNNTITASVTKVRGVNRKKSHPSDYHKSDGEESCHVVTLPLLPETPDLSPRGNNSDDSFKVGNNKTSVPTWLCFGRSDQQDLTAQEVVTSDVVVEGVTDAWMDGNGLGRTDDERMRRLDNDTCPGFISDGLNRVWWTNEAYRKMVNGEEREDTWRKEKVVVVRLGMREKGELGRVKVYPAFTCRVRVQYGSHTMTVPCDVWRMNGGGFAWRLDVKAALSLSL